MSKEGGLVVYSMATVEMVRRILEEELALRTEGGPPERNYRKHIWLRYARRGRHIIRETVLELTERTTIHIFRRTEVAERRMFVDYLMDALDALGALDVFQPAVEEERRLERESRERGRGRPCKRLAAERQDGK